MCVITRCRPASLERLLEALAHCELPSRLAWKSTVVVDNDVNGSARPVVGAATPRHPVDLVYATEPVPGVSAARNTAVRSATTRFVAFIDDDMTPHPKWLSALVAGLTTFEADVVIGPVPIDFDITPPPGLRESGVLDFETWEHGAQIDTLRTGNLLLDRQGLSDPLFDDRLAFSGGEDHLLGRELAADGKRIVFVADATATEWTPEERLTEEALRQRQHRIGFAYTNVGLLIDPGMKSTVQFGALAAARLVVGGLLSAGVLPIERRWRGHQLRWFGRGMLAAVFRRENHYYR